MSFMDAREHGSKPGSGGAASAQNEVRSAHAYGVCKLQQQYLLNRGRSTGHRQARASASSRPGDYRPIQGPILHAQSLGTGMRQCLPSRQSLRALHLQG